MRLTVRQTHSAVHLCDETGEERYLLQRRPFHGHTLLTDLKSGRVFYVDEKERPHPWNRQGEVLCTLTDGDGTQVLSARAQFEREQLPPRPFRHGALLVHLPGQTLRVERTGETAFRVVENGRVMGMLDCGSYIRAGQAAGLEDGLALTALFGWCMWFRQADCRITV